MTITINLTSDEEAQLRKKATQEGADTETVARILLLQALEWDAQDRAEAMEGIKRGLQASDAGRVRPFDEFASEMRAKHQLPVHLSDEEVLASP